LCWKRLVFLVCHEMTRASLECNKKKETGDHMQYTASYEYIVCRVCGVGVLALHHHSDGVTFQQMEDKSSPLSSRVVLKRRPQAVVGYCSHRSPPRTCTRGASRRVEWWVVARCGQRGETGGCGAAVLCLSSDVPAYITGGGRCESASSTREHRAYLPEIEMADCF